MSDVEKVILSSDQQIPFHDKRMVELYFKVMKWFKPEHVVLAGDHDDMCMYSRWVDGGTQEFVNTLPESPKTDVDGWLSKVFENSKPVKEFYARHNELAPNAQKMVALGNHDIRAFGYFDKKNPEIMEHITPNALWGLDDLGYDWIDYAARPKHFAGGFYVHHGVSISKHAGESVKQDMENFGVSLIRGHSHRQAIIHRTYPLRNETVTGIELGHMMDINCSGASYDNVHNWQPGFAIGYIESGATNTPDGKRFHPQLVQISRDYTCVIEGKVFRA